MILTNLCAIGADAVDNNCLDGAEESSNSVGVGLLLVKTSVIDISQASTFNACRLKTICS